MKRRNFLQAVTALAGTMALGAHKAQAQTPPRRDLRLVFGRGGELFACSGLDGADARRVLTLGSANTLWAVSPDGRRVVWLPSNALTEREKNPAFPPGARHQGLGVRPVSVFLSDMLGRHQKKLLTTTDLRDRQGKPVIKAGVENADDLSAWDAGSVGWSADGRTIYLGCFYDGGRTERGTFAADALSGAALVDGDGRWKRIAALSHIDAQGGLLLGVGDDLPKPQIADASSEESGSLVVLNLAEGGGQTVFGSRKPLVGNKMAPGDYAENPALAPDHRSIAYVSGIDGGLWLRDRWAASSVEPRKLALKAAGRPQWTDTNKTVFYLVPSSEIAGASPRDLYRLDVPVNSADVPTEPRLVLQNVDNFALAPL